MASSCRVWMSALLCAAAAPPAVGDVVVTFSQLTVAYGQTSQLLPDPATSLTGQLTGVSIDAVLDQSWSPGFPVRNLFLLVNRPISGFHVTVGGTSNPFTAFESPQWYAWPNGDSGVPGTPLSGSVEFDQPIHASQITNLAFGIPQGMGTWLTVSGSLTLEGVSYVPGPGAVSLLCVAGVARRARRRDCRI